VVLIGEEARRDAAKWAELAERHQITLWNSVPVLLDMLLIAAQSAGYERLPFRLAMLSGDWIGLDLPERLKQAAPDSELVAMGGATE
ncbi:AMP-binding protein, partial [Streptomyces sp. CHB9.2]|nr:AMP-binding protein [Streptomyces sp. CHB9.2]